MSDYRPQPGTLANRVCAYFIQHAEERLSAADIALKFDVPSKSIEAALAACLSHKMLERVRSGGRGFWEYRAGPNLHKLVDVAPPTPSRAAVAISNVHHVPRRAEAAQGQALGAAAARPLQPHRRGRRAHARDTHQGHRLARALRAHDGRRHGQLAAAPHAPHRVQQRRQGLGQEERRRHVRHSAHQRHPLPHLAHRLTHEDLCA
jgi:hypothetical protein